MKYCSFDCLFFLLLALSMGGLLSTLILIIDIFITNSNPINSLSLSQCQHKYSLNQLNNINSIIIVIFACAAVLMQIIVFIMIVVGLCRRKRQSRKNYIIPLMLSFLFSGTAGGKALKVYLALGNCSQSIQNLDIVLYIMGVTLFFILVQIVALIITLKIAKKMQVRLLTIEVNDTSYLKMRQDLSSQIILQQEQTDLKAKAKLNAQEEEVIAVTEEELEQKEYNEEDRQERQRRQRQRQQRQKEIQKQKWRQMQRSRERQRQRQIQEQQQKERERLMIEREKLRQKQKVKQKQKRQRQLKEERQRQLQKERLKQKQLQQKLKQKQQKIRSLSLPFSLKRQLHESRQVCLEISKSRDPNKQLQSNLSLPSSPQNKSQSHRSLTKVNQFSIEFFPLRSNYPPETVELDSEQVKINEPYMGKTVWDHLGKSKKSRLRKSRFTIDHNF